MGPGVQLSRGGPAVWKQETRGPSAASARLGFLDLN